MVTTSFSAQISDTNQPVKSLFPNLNFSQSSDPNFVPNSSHTPGLARLLFSIVLMIVLAIAALYLSKKVLPKYTQSSGKKIKISETVYLGPRKALHLVNVGKQTFLLGSTNEKITMLSDINSESFQANLENQLTKDIK
jgi:flagellar biosynthetic protein FliO